MISTRALGLVIVLAGFCLTSPAHAQDSSIVIQLQHRLVAERRLADDREAQILREREAERLSLQRQLDAAQRSGTASAAQLAVLRHRLNEAVTRERELLTEILRKDPASVLITADLESELTLLGASASPQLKAALSAFGSGDRSSAWPRIQAIARTGTSREKRVAARLRTIMFNYQDPGVTAQDIRDRWAEAVAADPRNSLALAALAAAEQLNGNSEAALATLARAAAVAKSPQERHLIAWQRVAAAYTLQRPELMVSLLREQIAAIRALEGPAIGEANRKALEAQAQASLAGFLVNMGKTSEAISTYAEAIGLYRELRRGAPNLRYVDEAAAAALLQKGSLEVALNKAADARASNREASEMLEDRVKAGPTDAAQANTLLAQAYANQCNLTPPAEAATTGVVTCQKALKAEKLMPESAQRDFTLARDSSFVGRLLWSLGRREEAKTTLREAVSYWGRLAALEQLPGTLLGYAESLHTLASVDETVCWRDVTAAWQKLAAVVQLVEPQKSALLFAQSRGDAGCRGVSTNAG